MRYTMMIAAYLFACVVVNAQISTVQKSVPSVTVGKVSPGVLIAELTYQVYPDSKDTLYTLFYRDYQYKKIVDVKSVKFSGIGDTKEQLYQAFKSVFLEENRNNKDYLINFTLGDKPVAIGTSKSMGSTLAMFLYNRSYFYLTDKQVDKLFGK